MRLQPHALVYNLATFLRAVTQPEEVADASFTGLQLKLIKIGACVVRHPRHHPPIASATVMRLPAIHAQSQRKYQGRPARCAEKHRRRAQIWQIRRLIRPV